MRFYTSLIFLFLTSLPVSAQSDSISKDTCPCESPVWTYAEDMPNYPGGEYAWREYLHEKTKSADISGTVYVNMTVDRDGNVCHVEVRKGIKNRKDIDQLAADAVRQSKPWIPAKHKGDTVCISMIIPVRVGP